MEKRHWETWDFEPEGEAHYVEITADPDTLRIMIGAQGNQTQEGYWRDVATDLAQLVDRLKKRLKEEEAWAQHREDMFVAVRQQLRRAGAIRPHEEITVEDAIERLLRQVPARTFDMEE